MRSLRLVSFNGAENKMKEYRVDWRSNPDQNITYNTKWYKTQEEADRMADSIRKDGDYVVGIIERRLK